MTIDISPGNDYIRVGDTVTLTVVGSGCSLGGHDGHIYVDATGTGIPAGLLWIAATGPAVTIAQQANTITYTYTYTNSSSSTASNVVVTAAMPQVATPPGAVTTTTFQSYTAPTVGSSVSCTAPAVNSTNSLTCNLGNLAAGASGTFTISVKTDSSWLTTSGPINNGNYTIGVNGGTSLVGPLVQTELVAAAAAADMSVSVTGMPTSVTSGGNYNGSFTCSNLTSGVTATSATCGITNLPTGLAVGQCTISPSPPANWTGPADVPGGRTVTCPVTGTATGAVGNVTANVTTSATNDSTTANNSANVVIAVVSSGVALIGDLSNMPANGVVGQTYAGTYSCRNAGSNDAADATCPISGLPAGFSVTGCSISPSATAWTGGTGSTIPSGETVTCSVSGTPGASGSVTANVTPTTSSSSPSITSVNGSISFLNGTDMAASSTGLPSTAPAGASYTGTYTCTNITSVAAVEATCTVAGLPTGVSLQSCTNNGGAWTGPATVPANSTVTCTVSGTPTSDASSQVTVTTSAVNDTNATNNTATRQINNADLAIVKSASSSSPVIGGNVTFTLTATNNGPALATGVIVTDSLPAGYTLVSSSPSVGTYDGTSWTIGNLANGSSASMQVVATVNATGSYANTASVSGDQDDSDSSNDSATSIPVPVSGGGGGGGGGGGSPNPPAPSPPEPTPPQPGPTPPTPQPVPPIPSVFAEPQEMSSPINSKVASCVPDVSKNPTGTSYQVISQPQNGNVVMQNDGCYSFSPSTNFRGLDSFTYSACLPAPNSTVCAQSRVAMDMGAPTPQTGPILVSKATTGEAVNQVICCGRPVSVELTNVESKGAVKFSVRSSGRSVCSVKKIDSRKALVNARGGAGSCTVVATIAATRDYPKVTSNTWIFDAFR